MGFQVDIARAKHSDAAPYLASPVLNRAPKRSPNNREVIDVVVRALDSRPRDPSEMLRRVADALPPDVAMTYTLREYAVAIFKASGRPLKKIGEPLEDAGEQNKR